MSVFIVRPFGKKGDVDFNRVEAELIQPAMAAAGVTGGTTGLIARSGNIRLDMFERLVLADLVVADISINNANVFYELGIRHALRHRPTILIRFKGSRDLQEKSANPDDVPFDLRTDRYLEYDLADLGAGVPFLTGAITDSLRAKNVDSPVYLLLPKLEPPSTDTLRGVPEEFQEAVLLAVAKKDWPRLGLLAEEIDDLDWTARGRRLVAKAFFDNGAWAGARIWYEAVREKQRDDVDANLKLGTVYQKLGDLPQSNAALERLLGLNKLSATVGAEKRALLASNRKTQWMAKWQAVPAETRTRTALAKFPSNAMDAYDAGFVEDQNHFYSGLNALSLRVLQLELATLEPGAWNADFETEEEAAAALSKARAECEALKWAVDRSIDAGRKRHAALVAREPTTQPDVWMDFSLADLRFLTWKRPAAVAACYDEAMSNAGGKRFYAEAAARQLRMFRDLGVFVGKAEAALEVLGEPFELPPAEPTPRQRVIVFSGHRIDKPGRNPPRFPATRERTATAAIRARVAAEKGFAKEGPIKGIAGGASGGDIIFHEVCQTEGIPTTLLLALPVPAYAAASVNDGGSSWTERYNQLVQRVPPRILGGSEELPAWVAERRDYSIWHRNNLWTLHTALAEENADVTLIVLWDGKAGDGPGGTADMVKLAEKRGVKIVRIDPAELPDE